MVVTCTLVSPSHRGSTANETRSHCYMDNHKMAAGKITLTFDGRRFCVPKFRYSTLQQTTRHWCSPTSCFGLTNHTEWLACWTPVRGPGSNRSHDAVG